MDLFGPHRALFSGPSFQLLPSLQLLVPFHLPGHGAAGKTINKRGRQQDCVTSQILNWSYKQPELDSLIYWIFRWFPQIIFSRMKIQTVDILYWLVEPIFRQRIPKQWYQWLGQQNQQTLNNPNHPRLSVTPRPSDPASPAHRPPGEDIWVPLQRDQRKWMIMMFSLKHA